MDELSFLSWMLRIMNKINIQTILCIVHIEVEVQQAMHRPCPGAISQRPLLSQLYNGLFTVRESRKDKRVKCKISNPHYQIIKKNLQIVLRSFQLERISNKYAFIFSGLLSPHIADMSICIEALSVDLKLSLKREGKKCCCCNTLGLFFTAAVFCCRLNCILCPSDKI